MYSSGEHFLKLRVNYWKSKAIYLLAWDTTKDKTAWNHYIFDPELTKTSKQIILNLKKVN